MTHAQELIPLLKEDPPKVTLSHTVHLCRHVENSFDAISLKNDQVSSKFKLFSPQEFYQLEKNVIDYYEVNFAFCAEFLAKMPSIFSLPSRQFFEKDFTLWVLAKILHILALEETGCLQKAGIDCCFSFLKNLTHDIRVHVNLCLVKQLHELCSFNENIGKLNASTPLRLFATYLDDFMLDANENGKILSAHICPPDTFLNLVECERLQCSICLLLSNCVESLLYEIPNKDQWILWDCIIRQLQYADLELKNQSINLCLSLCNRNFYVLGAMKYCTDFVLGLICWIRQEYGSAFDPQSPSCSTLVNFVLKYLKFLDEVHQNDGQSSLPFERQTAQFFCRMIARCLKLSTEIGGEKVEFFASFSTSLVALASSLAKSACRRFDADQFDPKSSLDVKILIAAFLKRIFASTSEKSTDFGESSAKLCVHLMRLYYHVSGENLGSSNTPDPIDLICDYFTACSEKIGDDKDVLIIVKNFLIGVEVIFQLIRDVTMNCVKPRLNQAMDHMMDKMVGEKCPSLFNALTFCSKIMDRSLSMAVFQRVIGICCLCMDFLVRSEPVQKSYKDKFIKLLLEEWPNADTFDGVTEPLLRYFGQIVRYGSGDFYTSAAIHLTSYATDATLPLALCQLAAAELRAAARQRSLAPKELYAELAPDFTRILLRQLTHALKNVPPSQKTAADLQQSISATAPVTTTAVVDGGLQPTALSTGMTSAANSVDEPLKNLLELKINRLCTTFEFVRSEDGSPDWKQWCRFTEKYFVPNLVMFHCSEASRVHKTLASLLNTNRNVLIYRNISHVVTKLALSGVDNEECREIVNFVEKEASMPGQDKLSFALLLSGDIFNCTAELLCNLGSEGAEENRVLNTLHKVLEIYSYADEDFVAEDKNSSEVLVHEIRDELNKRFFGILIRFEEKLRFTNSSRDKLCVLLSFARFMQICDSKILGDAKLKALSILKYAATLSMGAFDPDDRRFEQATDSAWLALVRRLPADDLRRACLQILVALTERTLSGDCDDQRMIANDSPLAFLVGEMRRELNEQLDDFAFLLECPPLSSIKPRLPSDLLGRLTLRQPLTLSKRDVKRELSQAMKIASDESADVKRCSLRRLAFLLRDRQADVYRRLICGADNVDVAVLRSIDFVLSSLNHSDADVRLLAAVCFGEMGAVDPGRLRSSNADFSPDDKISSCAAKNVDDFVAVDLDDQPSNVKFAVRLLLELHKNLVGSTVGVAYNVMSYAVQEILKFFGCGVANTATTPVTTLKASDAKKSAAMTPSAASLKIAPLQATVGETIWNSLPDDVRTTLTPFLHTHYVISKNNNDVNVEVKYPLFGNKEVTDFKQWLLKILLDLISKIKNPRGLTLFEPLSMAAETNLNFARFLLPHVILQKLKEGDDPLIQAMLEEIKIVLSFDRSICSDHTIDNKFAPQAAQEIFLLLDFLTAWNLKYRALPEKQLERRRIENFLKGLPQMTVVDCATRCQAYTRALMSYEAFINETKGSSNAVDSAKLVQPFLAKLQELYSHLGDIDSVVGVLEVRKSKTQPSPKEEILALECIGNYTEALPFHELLIASEPEKLENHAALVKCLLKLNQSNLALRYIDGLVGKDAQFEDKIRAYKIETLCKLEDWKTLEDELKKTESSKTWGRDVADLLLTVKKGESTSFSEKLNFLRNDVLHRLHTVALDSSGYDRVYKHLLRLHMISEIENGAASFVGLKELDFVSKSPEELVEVWDSRFDVLQASTDVLNNVLEMRRKIFSLVPPTSEHSGLVTDSVKKSWLQSLRIARKSGHLQSALSLLAKVKALDLPEAFEEEAKLLWLKGDQDAATNCLFRGLNEHYAEFLTEDSKKSTASAEKRVAFAKAQLRMANYARESSSSEFNDITRMYDLVIGACPQFEDAHYYFALHFDLLESKRTNFKNQEWCAMRQKILTSYGTGLQNGSKFLHHVMPRMLTLWLDATSKLNGAKPNSTPSLRSKSTGPSSSTNADHLRAVNALMTSFGQSLPIYQFYSSFSQLISRIAHPCPETVLVLKEIIARCILAYPQQCLWMSIAVSRSSVSKRREIFDEIFKIVGKKKPSMSKLIKDFQKLRDFLQTLCFHKEASFRTTCLNMKEKFPELFRLFNDGSFSRIMLPLQSLMDVTLPMPMDARAPDENFNPFPNQCVYIECFENLIEVFPTLQRPKKVGMRGSDGKSYSVLCKPKDDLRVDKRVMEFAGLVNVFLLRYPETRRRQLTIRTYAVVPLSEDFGLLEWVPGLQALRTILLSIYKETGAGLPNDKLKELCPKIRSDAEKLKIFNDQLLPRYPSVLSVWLRRCFAEPTAWFHARTNFTHSAAVMSVVGFVLGLGDRHGENILLDTCAGHAMHVDFNCLFDRGQELDVPELVPFRLTHNMVDAMGPLGYDGPFRKTCEATMRVLRKERETLRTVLATFLYDPLVEWRKHDERIKMQQQQQAMMQMQLQQPETDNQQQIHQHDVNKEFAGECVSDKAQQYLKNIDFRLNGCVSLRPNVYGTSLSVEAQVSHLIRQATDPKLLSKMYVGWAPYM